MRLFEITCMIEIIRSAVNNTMGYVLREFQAVINTY